MCEVTLSEIIRQFGALKTQYIDKMDENKALRETVDLLTNRLQTKEDHRLRLIGLFKQHTDKHRKREQSLQDRIDQLETLVAEQRRSIGEHSKRIVVLESTVAEQSAESESYLNTISKLNEEVASLKNHLNQANNNNNNSIINVSNQSIKKNSAAAALNLNHPSFSIDSKEPSKRRRKSKAQMIKKERRWSNLKITVSGSNVSKDNIGINSSNSSNSESDLSSSREKRRKLYHVDEDATIDLSNDKD